MSPLGAHGGLCRQHRSRFIDAWTKLDHLKGSWQVPLRPSIIPVVVMMPQVLGDGPHCSVYLGLWLFTWVNRWTVRKPVGWRRASSLNLPSSHQQVRGASFGTGSLVFL